MPKGTTVYHGTGMNFTPEQLESPCWVSTSMEVARYFVTWHDAHNYDDDDYEPQDRGKRIIQYKTNRLLRLMYVESRHTFDEIEERYGFDMRGSSKEMAEVICKLGYDGWYIEANFQQGDDTMLCDSSVLSFVGMHSP